MHDHDHTSEDARPAEEPPVELAAPPEPVPVESGLLADVIRTSVGQVEALFAALEEQENFPKARAAWYDALLVLGQRGDEPETLAALAEARALCEQFEVMAEPLPTEPWELAALLEPLDDKSWARALQILHHQVGDEQANQLFDAMMAEVSRNEQVTHALGQAAAGLVELRRGLGRYRNAITGLGTMHADYENGERTFYVDEIARALRVLELMEKEAGLDTTSYAAGAAISEGGQP